MLAGSKFDGKASAGTGSLTVLSGGPLAGTLSAGKDVTAGTTGEFTADVSAGGTATVLATGLVSSAIVSGDAGAFVWTAGSMTQTSSTPAVKYSTSFPAISFLVFDTLKTSTARCGTPSPAFRPSAAG